MNAEQGRPKPPTATTYDHRRHDEQQRPQDVELLLDRQRPEVLDGTGVLTLCQVVDGLSGEPPVDDVQRACGDVAGGGEPAQWRQEHPGQGDRREQDDHRGGQQALDPAGVEAGDREPSGPLDLGNEQAGDEEPGDHEEDVDTDEAAVEERQAGVIDQDRPDGDRP